MIMRIDLEIGEYWPNESHYLHYQRNVTNGHLSVWCAQWIKADRETAVLPKAFAALFAEDRTLTGSKCHISVINPVRIIVCK